MTELFREQYDKDTLRAIPVLTLAHIGDGVYARFSYRIRGNRTAFGYEVYLLGEFI